ncbi:hypothetical protein HMPREF9210_0849 [Lactobacillus iners SPIN 1401G]|nr:hypothetical protein HMPREF9210_0849 [Lactobacillus iners SPIN 1401G]
MKNKSFMVLVFKIDLIMDFEKFVFELFCKKIHEYISFPF